MRSEIPRGWQFPAEKAPAGILCQREKLALISADRQISVRYISRKKKEALNEREDLFCEVLFFPCPPYFSAAAAVPGLTEKKMNEKREEDSFLFIPDPNRSSLDPLQLRDIFKSFAGGKSSDTFPRSVPPEDGERTGG